MHPFKPEHLIVLLINSYEKSPIFTREGLWELRRRHKPFLCTKSAFLTRMFDNIKTWQYLCFLRDSKKWVCSDTQLVEIHIRWEYVPLQNWRWPQKSGGSTPSTNLNSVFIAYKFRDISLILIGVSVVHALSNLPGEGWNVTEAYVKGTASLGYIMGFQNGFHSETCPLCHYITVSVRPNKYNSNIIRFCFHPYAEMNNIVASTTIEISCRCRMHCFKPLRIGVSTKSIMYVSDAILICHPSKP